MLDSKARGPWGARHEGCEYHCDWVGVVVLGVLAKPADAERWRQAVTDPAYPHITVQSELYPSETISAPVRSGPRGDEVRLPGGTWVPCGFNCYFTLRNATIDFWRRYDVFAQ
jgi:hypothetical protein